MTVTRAVPSCSRERSDGCLCTITIISGCSRSRPITCACARTRPAGEVEREAHKHLLAEAVLVGLYQR